MVLRERGVAFAVIGAAAMAVLGVSRSTRDVDVLALESGCLATLFWDALASAGAEIDIHRGEADDPLAGVVRFRETDEQLLAGSDRRDVIGQVEAGLTALPPECQRLWRRVRELGEGGG